MAALLAVSIASARYLGWTQFQPFDTLPPAIGLCRRITSRMIAMNNLIIRRGTRVLASFLVFACCCIGCTTWDAGSRDATATNPWDFDLRQPTRPGQVFGVNAQSREIEQNLGVR